MFWVCPNPKYVPGGVENFWTKPPTESNLQASSNTMHEQTRVDKAGTFFSGFICNHEMVGPKRDKEKKCKIVLPFQHQGYDFMDMFQMQCV